MVTEPQVLVDSHRVSAVVALRVRLDYEGENWDVSAMVAGKGDVKVCSIGKVAAS